MVKFKQNRKNHGEAYDLSLLKIGAQKNQRGAMVCGSLPYGFYSNVNNDHNNNEN